MGGIKIATTFFFFPPSETNTKRVLSQRRSGYLLILCTTPHFFDCVAHHTTIFNTTQQETTMHHINHRYITPNQKTPHQTKKHHTTKHQTLFDHTTLNLTTLDYTSPHHTLYFTKGFHFTRALPFTKTLHFTKAPILHPSTLPFHLGGVDRRLYGPLGRSHCFKVNHKETNKDKKTRLFFQADFYFENINKENRNTWKSNKDRENMHIALSSTKGVVRYCPCHQRLTQSVENIAFRSRQVRNY